MRFPTGGRVRGCLVHRSGQDVALGREPAGIPHGSPGVRYPPVPLSQSHRRPGGLGRPALDFDTPPKPPPLVLLSGG